MDIFSKIVPIFSMYEKLLVEVDNIFVHVKDTFLDCMCCNAECSECCYALFDVSLIEAMYINKCFNNIFDSEIKRSMILESAIRTDRNITKLKKAFTTLYTSQDQENVNDVMDQAARERVRCVLLGEDDQCILYESRPITCRLYGIPIAIGGKSYVCGKTKFCTGTHYPSVYIEKIQNKLSSMSFEIQTILSSRFQELYKVYVPISMALLTEYNDQYLGLSCSYKKGSIKMMLSNFFIHEESQSLTVEQEQLKQEIYMRMAPRRKKYIDRIGYEVWNPFQSPNDPLDMRLDVSKHTMEELIQKFFQNMEIASVGKDFKKGVTDCAFGMVNKDERYLGIFEFCVWYYQLLKQEGVVHNERDI